MFEAEGSRRKLLTAIFGGDLLESMDVPKDFALVVLVVILMFFVQLWFSIMVIVARGKYNVPYPAMYASETENENAKTFNCVQRGHQNFLESAPIFLALLLTAGVKHPRLASIFGFLYLISRVIYFIDYSSGDPERRMRGIIMANTCLSMLVVWDIWFVVQLFIQ